LKLWLQHQDESEIEAIYERTIRSYFINIQVASMFMKDCETIFKAYLSSKSVLAKYETSLDKCESDIKSLLKPQSFITTYPRILKEVNRRNVFNDYIHYSLAQTLADINSVIQREQEERS
jgi:hypothetical protein